MTTNTYQTPAYWQGLFQPLAAVSDDPDDRKEAVALLKKREQFKRDLPSFMVGWHEMQDHLRANGIKAPSPITTVQPKVTPKTPAPKKSAANENPKRRSQLRSLHDTVRGLLATHHIAVDTTPRAPKRVGDEVNYYLLADEDIMWTAPLQKDVENTVKDGLKAFFGPAVSNTQMVWDADDSYPFKLVVTYAG